MESIQPISEEEIVILRRVIKAIRKSDPSKFGDMDIPEDFSTTLESLTMDSLDVIQTAFAVEEEFELEGENVIDDEDLEKVRTLGDIVSVVFIQPKK